MDTLEMQVERATKLAHEKMQLESKLTKQEQMFNDLAARYATLQDQHWKLQDRHLKLQETLTQKLY